jgi:hypothetical protein
MFMKKNLSLGVLAAGFVSAVQIASATEVQYTYTGETGGGEVLGIHTSDYNGYALVGEFIMTSSTPGFTTPLLTYCTDVDTFLSTTYNYTPTPITATTPTGVSPTWTSGGIQNAATLWYNDKAAASAGGALSTAGLQLAIWELLYNNITGGYSFTSQNNNGFYITSTDSTTLAVENYAANLLGGLGSLSAAQNVEWMAPTMANGSIGGSQGLLYQTVGSTDLTAPDSTSSLALFGLAVIALGAVSRKLCCTKG